MMLIRGIFVAFAQMCDLILQIYIFIVIARVLISWVNPDPYNAIVRFLCSVTDPLLYRMRRLIPLQFSGIDFSPVVLLLALTFLKQVIYVLFLQIAAFFS